MPVLTEVITNGTQCSFEICCFRKTGVVFRLSAHNCSMSSGWWENLNWRTAVPLLPWKTPSPVVSYIPEKNKCQKFYHPQTKFGAR